MEDQNENLIEDVKKLKTDDLITSEFSIERFLQMSYDLKKMKRILQQERV